MIKFLFFNRRLLKLKWYLGGEVANIVLNKYGAIDYEWGIKSASTDFVRHSDIYILYYY